MPNEFVARNGVIALNNSTITGSLIVTGSTTLVGTSIITGSLTVISGSSIELQVIDTGIKVGNLVTDTHTVTGSLNVSGSITGSLFGTSSFAVSASWAPGGGGSSAPGDKITTGSITASVDVTGATFRLISGSSTYLYVSSSGNVGIGTSSPNDMVHISSSGNDRFLKIQNSNSYTGIWLEDSGANNGWLLLSGYTSVTSPGDFAIREYGVQTSLTIKSGSGNIGIGTIAPAAKLQVSGTVNVANIRGSGSATTQSIFTVDGAAGRLFSVNDSLSGSLFSVNTIAGLPVVEAFSDNTVRIGQYGRRVLFVSQSRVGVGKETALNATLDISGSAVITGSLNVNGSITGSLLGTSSFATTASFALNAGGSSGGGFPFTGSAIITGSLTVTGAISSNSTVTAVSLVETSAQRYKQNVQTLGSGDLIYQLRPVTFDWITTQKSDIGFIAEEVNEIFPMLTEVNEKGETEGVKYSKLTAILTKALQVHEQCLKDQQKEIDELKQEINVLKNK